MACYFQRSIFIEKEGERSVATLKSFCAASMMELKLHNEASPFLKIYVFLSISYAIGNQMVFKIMHVADPGILSLIKSTAPVIVAVLNFVLYKKVLSIPQLQCAILLMCGLIAVTNPPCEKDANMYTFFSLALMAANTGLSALNSVVNANALKELQMSMPLQNMTLYMFGFAVNMILYLVTSTGEGFFFGYGSLSVWVLILLNASNGLAINAVFKYGDAVLKTFSQPLCSAILVLLSWALFGMHLDRVKLSGAIIVIMSTFMYIKAPR